MLKVECVSEDLKVFMKVYFYFMVMGCNLNLVMVECVINLLYDKYCFVLIMIVKMVEFMYLFDIVVV